MGLTYWFLAKGGAIAVTAVDDEEEALFFKFSADHPSFSKPIGADGFPEGITQEDLDRLEEIKRTRGIFYPRDHK